MTDVDDYWEPDDDAEIARAEEEAERHERYCHRGDGGGGECDCPPYVPPVCRLLARVPRWTPRGGWRAGTPGGCDTAVWPTPWAAWRAHRRSHQAPF